MENRLAYLGLGSNLGHRETFLDRAVRSLMDDAPNCRTPILTDIRLSPVYETDPVGKLDQPPFLNAVVEGRTALTPTELLASVKKVEQDLGRQERERNGPREIDVDLLHLEGVEHATDPILPHPRCHERMFVLRPLADLAPDLVLPGQAKPVKALLAELPRQGVRKAYRQWEAHPHDDTRDLIPTIPLHPFPKLLYGLGEITTGMRRAICEGLCAVGAVRIENAVPPALVERLTHEARRAFALHDDIKRRSWRSPNHSGYTPPGVEGVRGHGADQLRHFWDLDTSRAVRPEPETEGFYAAAHLVLPPLRSLSNDLFQAFDHEFRTWIYRSSQGGPHMIRVSQYLNAEASPWQVLFPSHLDFGLLTAYVGGAEEGLQVKIHGAWHDLYNPPGSVVFGVGSTLKLYAPNELQTIRHRVVARSTGRISTIYFTEPRGDVLLPNGKTAYDHLHGWLTKIRQDPKP
jgi:2-amino-4-hydroxy-6-hydroxymethyldihydropteridine diphosphokinase